MEGVRVIGISSVYLNAIIYILANNSWHVSCEDNECDGGWFECMNLCVEGNEKVALVCAS